MRAYRPRIRFENGAPHPGRRATEFDIVQIRKLLRTDMSLLAIAMHLGTKPYLLHNFIKRRNICDLREREKFIKLQASIAKLPEPA